MTISPDDFADAEDAVDVLYELADFVDARQDRLDPGQMATILIALGTRITWIHLVDATDFTNFVGNAINMGIEWAERVAGDDTTS